MSLANILQQNGTIASIADELGVDENTALAGARALLPALVAGMGRQTVASPGSGGLGGLGDILGQSLGGGSAGGLGGALGGGLGGVLLDAVLKKQPTPTQPGNDILGQIFGSKDVSRGVAEEVAGSTGIPAELLKKMLPILAMAVVGYMMNQKQGGAAGGGGLGGALGGILGQVVTGMMRR
ncbi:MAG: DUF937 domain-containing protein [Erythrobacter sp.]